MKKLVIILVFLPLILRSQQDSLLKTTYQSFNNQMFNVYQIEGIFTILLIEESLLSNDKKNDIQTIKKILDQIDGYYAGFKSFYGIEPIGGNPNYNNKANVFFGSPSCGAACGLIGAKGVEIGGAFFTPIFNEIKYQTNTHRLGIVGYEFGRNFFTLSDKILFPFNVSKDEKNGGFAEGFANLGQLESYIIGVYPGFQADRRKYQETNAYHLELKKLLLAYINNAKINPGNALIKESKLHDHNRNSWALDIPSFLASGILIGTYNLFGKPSMKEFIKSLESRTTAPTPEYAMGSIAFGFSKAMNVNLNNYFKNVLKFNIDLKSQEDIANLPSISENRLIRDLPILYFASPLDTLSLNIRSLDYNPSSETVYRVIINDKVFSESKHGNNKLTYNLLTKEDSLVIKVQMIEFNSLKDQYSIILKKRKSFYLLDHNTYLYSTNSYGKVVDKGDLIRIENISSNFQIPIYDNNIVLSRYPIFRDRKIRISGSLRNINIDNKENSCNVAIGGRWGSHGPERVGIDIGFGDTSAFYKTEIDLRINDFFFNSDESAEYQYLSQELLVSTNNSICEGKNIFIEDITDLDNDGFTDFNDHCPLLYGNNQGCPETSGLSLDNYQNIVNIYPNPLRGKMIVNSNINGTIKLFTSSGVELLNFNKNDIIQEFAIPDLPQGLYLLKITGLNQNYIKKIIISQN